MKKKITLDTSKKVFPLILMCIGLALMLAEWIVAYCCLISAAILLSLLIKKRVYAPMIFGYAAASLGVVIYYIIWGADAGFGAFTSGLAGFNSAEHPWLQGAGNFGTRLLGNLLLILPTALSLWGCSLQQNTPSKRKIPRKQLQDFAVFC